MADKVAVGVADDMGESMQCVDHPYRSNPSGVCAFCLQEKLGKLVSSSKSTPFLPLQPSPSSSTSSPTSFRDDVVAGGGGATGFASVYSCNGAPAYDGRRTKFSYLAVGRSKKKKGSGGDVGSYANGGRKFVARGTSHTTASVAVAKGSGLVLKRSKSVAPRTTGSSLAQVGVGRSNGDTAVADSPRKKSFWSFLYHSSVSSTSTSFSSAVNGNSHRRRSTSSSSGGGCEGDASKQHSQPPSNNLEAETGRKLAENSSAEDAQSPSGSQASSSFGRKVSRSRSVGCGSRSFSGDFLERISTGFSDCTLRRVESQREAKPKTAIPLDHNKNNDGDQQHMLKERIKCGGLFGGLGMMSAYWLSAAAADDYNIRSRASASTPAARTGVARSHGRTRTWGLAFASPMRAFRPYSSSSRSLYTINAAASTGPATNIISSINASKENINGHDGGNGKQSSLDSNASFMAVS